MAINPPPQQVPQQFASNAQLNDYFQRLHKFLYQLWTGEGGGGSTGGGTPGTGGGPGGGGGGGGSSSPADPATTAPAYAHAGAAFAFFDELTSRAAAGNPAALAHFGALRAELDELLARPVVETFNRIDAAGDIRATADGHLRVCR